ncbi:MAG: hypothetical protein CML50_04305 [Rhodobacteraceae bacterium]|jgi:hypothetical protein|uniref:Aminoglycoside phosphotransferase domain-containing protein n=1 Tax=Salipiger profundus TaxID=1229727 RepID=A0A1U7D2A5_9RHOB|nr:MULTISPECIES: DUF6206 family protein [Salipiger]APX22215.1 hypothetical protein Ga0080559_TMP1419 [Salipiger profundus]MAB05227.1 hypothetical protein [Paracoccaceae bacterium]GGA08302.1 hypothetical protein GCM10011326_20280 [Salipiger profundus]SFC48876.1 hypothetical protein SAMN05444415_103395 [Salipiger profundus]
MTDLAALAETIRRHEAAQGQPISRLGYFCAPFRPAEGPFADRVIKVYRGMDDAAMLERLAAAHDDYVAALLETGVPMPETAFHLLEMEGARVPVIVQEALPEASLMRPLMQVAPRDETLAMMEAAGQVIARFWNAADRFDTRIGFHPSIRNFAIVDGVAMFYDTFPPLIHYSRDEMGRMLLLFSEKRLMRLIGPFMKARVTGIQDEWYSPPETLVGLVGSACRLRPEHAEAYLSWGRDFAAREMPRWADEAIAGMQEAPRLPGYWTGFRKLLGLQGEPNV